MTTSVRLSARPSTNPPPSFCVSRSLDIQQTFPRTRLLPVDKRFPRAIREAANTTAQWLFKGDLPCVGQQYLDAWAREPVKRQDTGPTGRRSKRWRTERCRRPSIG